MAVHTPSLIAKNKQVLKPVLEKNGLNGRVLDALARRGNPRKMVDRLKRLVDAGVPLKGVVTKLKLSKADFEALLLRHAGKGGLNQGQQALFDFMREKKVPREIAMDIATRKTYHQMKIPEKFEYFESIELDASVYGVRRIPLKYYMHLLTKPLEEIKRGINRQVLWKLEDDFAVKRLDEVLPNWRNVKSFYREKNGKRILLRPSRIRRQITRLAGEGIPMRARHIVASLTRAKRDADMLGRNMRGRRKVLEGSELDVRVANRAAIEKSKRIRNLEEQIVGVNADLTALENSVSGSTTSQTIIRDDKRRLMGTRRRLVEERNKLL